MSLLLKNTTVVTGASCFKGALVLDGDKIAAVLREEEELPACGQTVDLGGLHIMAGAIDAHVHFREPGMTAKADIASESRAALLGGVTSFIDMPNNIPPAVSIAAVKAKADAALGRSFANFGFNIGATAANAAELAEAVKDSHIAGVKVFMGSSTGNMLLDESDALEKVFALEGKPVLVHSEDETLIRLGMEAAREKYGNDVPWRAHAEIRSRQACIRSSARALGMAVRLGTRLHLLHVSTAEEVEMVRAAKIHNPDITAETSVNYLWFCDEDYERLGARIKCNPSIKTAADRDALRRAVADGTVDTIGSDHAPHLSSEKDRSYFDCPSGIPGVAESVEGLLSIASITGMNLCRVASLLSEKPASVFRIKDRGLIAPGMTADLVVLDPGAVHVRRQEDIAYKCGWSPYVGDTFTGSVKAVFLAGREVVRDGILTEVRPHGQALVFA